MTNGQVRSLTALLTIFAIALLVSPVMAQCWNCDFNGYCYTTSSGHGSCVDRYYPSEPFCKMACPNCPIDPCDGGGGGGGGGGGCGAPFHKRDGDPTRTAVSFALVFQSTAALNAQIFGGQMSRVIANGASGDFTPGRVAQSIYGLGTGAASLPLAYAFSNYNNANIPVSLTTAGGDGAGFAPSAVGYGVRFEIHTWLANGAPRVADAVVGRGDLLLVSVTVHGESYILAIRSESMDRTSPTLSRDVENMKSLFKAGLQQYPPSTLEGHVPFEIC